MFLDHPTAPRALTLDLDDTLWPVWPTIRRAEQALHDWLVVQAPATAARFDIAGMRSLREQVAVDCTESAHDLARMRHETIRRALRQSGDDEQLADAAFDFFLAQRQRVELYDDALPALQRLAARFPILALSNGNADVERIGLGGHFVGSLSAAAFGVGKPHASIFHEACRRLGVEPPGVLHVGDDLHLDVHGALDAGLQAVWVWRGDEGEMVVPSGAHRVASLTELADALGC